MQSEWPALLDDLTAVAIAQFSPDGRLLAANAGWLRLAPGVAVGEQAQRFLISPTLQQLAEAAADGGESPPGLMTVGDPDGGTFTLRGRSYRSAGGFTIVAEHDVTELARVGDTAMQLTEELSKLTRELHSANRRLQQREAEVRLLSQTDQLTGLANRRRLDEAVRQELARIARHGGRLSVVMTDIDHFKRVNDEFGHETGDLVLREYASVLKEGVREIDLAARFGGEEFVLLLPGTEAGAAAMLAERIRARLEATRLGPLPRAVTASFGVAELRAGESWDSVLKRADDALYAAKNGGRNRVCVAPPA